MYKILSIAGSDSSGGAGIQADIKTIAAHGMFAMTAVTAVTVQNTTGVTGVVDIPPETVAAQIDAVFDDIPPDAVKIGMLSNKEIVSAIAGTLAERRPSHIVLDPVMVATSGSALAAGGSVGAMVRELFPLSEMITPNIPEAEYLAGMQIVGISDMERAADKIGEIFDGWILIKGGHMTETADDLLARRDKKIWIRGRRVANPNTHGTGCTLSSAIACGLAAGHDAETAVRRAKAYVTGALEAMLDLGRGSGPLDHTYMMKR